jgi:dephospho-CoA kinase
VIGLTGGVGMGKSTVSNYLAAYLPVLDADLYAREAVALDSPILAKIADRYGDSLLLSDGNLDRRHLGEIIFGNAAEKQWLEQQIHPYVRDRIMTELQNLAKAVVVIPLLFEAQMTDLVTEIWVVRSDLAQQQQRIMERDRLTLEQAQARIDSQMAIEQKVAQADVVLDNSTTLENLYQQIDRALHL